VVLLASNADSKRAANLSLAVAAAVAGDAAGAAAKENIAVCVLRVPDQQAIKLQKQWQQQQPKAAT